MSEMFGLGIIAFQAITLVVLVLLLRRPKAPSVEHQLAARQIAKAFIASKGGAIEALRQRVAERQKP